LLGNDIPHSSLTGDILHLDENSYDEALELPSSRVGLGREEYLSNINKNSGPVREPRSGGGSQRRYQCHYLLSSISQTLSFSRLSKNLLNLECALLIAM
jgi:hypothetical protein